MNRIGKDSLALAKDMFAWIGIALVLRRDGHLG